MAKHDCTVPTHRHMIYGHLKSPDTYRHLRSHPVWDRAFDWLERMPPDLEPGIHKIQGDDIYVNAHGYDTQPPEGCRFESHRRYVDLQYGIRGAELIPWSLASDLSPDGPYDDSTDLQFYQYRESKTVLHLGPGSFAVFYPPDAHLPKLRDGTELSIFKLVMKIKVTLLT